LASSAFAAMQNKATADSTAEHRAIRRYRMMTAPGGKAGKPAISTTPPGGTRKKTRECYRIGVYFLRPRAGINTRPRHFLVFDAAGARAAAVASVVIRA
jgi:hypothetical protein